MSTKISKGARLHLLRTVERLQYPMLMSWHIHETGKSDIGRSLRTLMGESLTLAFVLPPGVCFEFLSSHVSP